MVLPANRAQSLALRSKYNDPRHAHIYMYMIYSEGFLFNVSFAMLDSAWALLCSDKLLRKRFAN